MSEGYLKKIGKGATVSVDGRMAQVSLASSTEITIPPGVGRHRVEIGAE